MSNLPLSSFHPVLQAWFTERFGAPSPPQTLGWPAIASGEHTLILAPTGSGKTLAAFLKCLDTLYQEGVAPEAGVQVLYISPLKALGRDIHRNLQEPLAEIAAKAAAMGAPLPTLTAAVRTGDTSQQERARMLRHPPHILITTPESLYLMLTSQARRILTGVRYVILDEIHALCTTKRGAHLALSLERLEALTSRSPLRIGLSATQRPLEEVANFLGGPERRVQIVDAGMRKALDLQVQVPVDEMRSLPEGSLWPAIHERLLELIAQHRSTLIFVNYRGLAERLTEQLNRAAGRPIAKVHHGSMSRESREQVENDLKAGLLPCVVATASLELGIDIGSVDLVVQVESPKAVSAGLQRVGRAGHLLGAVAKGRLIPKYRGDLVEMACIVREMATGQVEQTKVPTGGLDVLAQQITAMAAMDEWRVADLLALCRRAYPYRALTERQLESIIQMLSGRFPAEEFRDLRPRLIWDPEAGTVRGREGARSLAILAGGTIPDRGYYGVYMEGGPRLGELEEEFIYESRVGDVFQLGTATWRIAAIEHDRITVTPAPGVMPRMPFWKGEGLGRPFELGQRVGAFLREVGANLEAPGIASRLMAECHLDERAAANLISYLRDQQAVTGALPSDRLLLAEAFWDEAGDKRIVLHSPFGGRVHLAWMTLLRRRIREQMGLEAELLQTDDGILVRLPGADRPPDIEKLLRVSPAEAEALLLEEVGSTPVFGAFFRMNAGRALLLPRPRPGQRRPFWIQRMRAADLLQVARRYDSFPIVLETYREVMQDLFDLQGLTSLLEGLATGAIALHVVETDGPSPMAASVMIGFVGEHIYDDETPKAERQSALLNLNREVLRELLGSERLRELLDPRAIATVSERLQRIDPEWQPRSVDDTEDLLRQVGDLNGAELAERGVEPEWLERLIAERRITELQLGGESRWVAAVDAASYGDPLTYAGPILQRYARHHGPFTLEAPASRYALPPETVRRHLELLVAEGALAAGEFTTGVAGTEYCDLTVLQQIHRQTLALLRAEVEPVDGPALARFLLAWHGLTGAPPLPPSRSNAPPPAALRRALSLLNGALLPLECWEGALLPSRFPNYQPLWLDQLCATGELAWAQAPGGRLALYLPERIGPYARRLQGARPDGLTPEQERILIALERLGADFLGGIARWSGLTPPEALEALLSLVRMGLVTNDTGAPLRITAGRAKGSAAMRAGTGRWSLTSRLLPPEPGGGAEGYTKILLERYGLLSYEVVKAEDGPYTWSELLDLLKRMELRGEIRRGYFVDGLSGYQFALPEAVDRLRGVRENGLEAVALVNLCDPANAWGSLLPLPVAIPRLATNWLVLLGGRPILAVESSGKRLTPLPDATEDELAAALGALRGLVQGSRRRLEIERWGEEPILAHPVSSQLQALGFERSPRSLVLYR